MDVVTEECHEIESGLAKMDSHQDFDGRAYGRPPAQPDDLLVKCGPGTLGGELLRRYWQPVARASELGRHPKKIKVLNEELVLFRDGSGSLGLFYPRCMHRGTDLVFGKIESRGLRCCYHGWLFDTTGRLLEAPCEPAQAKLPAVRQPWYPVIERHGLIFAYLGPPDRQPPFPRISITEQLDADEEIVVGASPEGSNGPAAFMLGGTNYNWFQFFDNFMDPFHVLVLHSTIAGVQLTSEMSVRPRVRFRYTADGVTCLQVRHLPDGSVHRRIAQIIMPNINLHQRLDQAVEPNVIEQDDGFGLAVAGINWTVPCDDTSYRTFSLMPKRRGVEPDFSRIGVSAPDWGPGKGEDEWTFEDHQTWQTDYIAQRGQGLINLHSDEHLTSIDAGTAMMRRQFREQAHRVARGEDPIGVDRTKPYHIQIYGRSARLDRDYRPCPPGPAQ